MSDAKPEAAPNLRRKLVSCMRDVERVELKGENKFHHYSYAKAADVFDGARKVFAQHGICLFVTEDSITDLPARQTRSEGTMLVVRVSLKITLMDMDTTETLEGISTGEGQDTGDKAIYKAKTASLKYFVQQTLLMSTGDDPEDEQGDMRVKVVKDAMPKAIVSFNAGELSPPLHAPSTPVVRDGAILISEAQRRRLYAIAKGDHDRIKAVIREFGYEHDNEIKRVDYDTICLKLDVHTKLNIPPLVAPMNDDAAATTFMLEELRGRASQVLGKDGALWLTDRLKTMNIPKGGTKIRHVAEMMALLNEKAAAIAAEQPQYSGSLSDEEMDAEFDRAFPLPEGK